MSPCPDALSRWPAMRLSDMSRTPQVESHRIFERPLFRGQAEQSRRMAEILEARQAPRLRFIRVDRQGLVVASAGMGNVVNAAAERAAAPAIENVEGERGVDIDGRVQRRRQLPRLEAYAGDVFAGPAGWRQRNEPSVAGDGMAAGIETLDLHLQPLNRGIDEARGDTGGRIFAQHVPRLERVPQFKRDAAVGDGAVERKTKLALGMKPLRIEVIAGAAKTFQNVEKVVPNEVRQHESVVQGRTPTYRRAALWLAPEPGDQRAQEQLLRQAHARVRRHFERAELYEAQPPGWTVGREQFVDTELGAVGIAGDVDEKIAKQAIDQPRPRWLALARRRHHGQRNLEFVELVVPRLVDARGLASRPDEQAGEQIGQRRVPLPVQN